MRSRGPRPPGSMLVGLAIVLASPTACMLSATSGGFTEASFIEWWVLIAAVVASVALLAQWARRTP